MIIMTIIMTIIIMIIIIMTIISNLFSKALHSLSFLEEFDTRNSKVEARHLNISVRRSRFEGRKSKVDG